MFYRIILILFLSVFSQLYSQELDEDSIDFSTPGNERSDDDETDCSLSKDAELIALLNFKLKKFNPTSKEYESAPPLTDEEIKHKSIRFYSLQLKDQRQRLKSAKGQRSLKKCTLRWCVLLDHGI